MTRCVFLNTAGDVFAANILYHRNCLKQYLLKYNRQVVVLFENIQRSNEAATIDLNYKQLFDNLDFNTNSFSLSHIRELVNIKLDADQHIDNRLAKVLLIKYFSDKICFTYPDDRRKSQMVYSSSLLENMLCIRYQLATIFTILTQIVIFIFFMRGLCVAYV